MRRRLAGQKRGEAGTLGGDLDLHVDLPSLDGQGQALGRSVLQALLLGTVACDPPEGWSPRA